MDVVAFRDQLVAMQDGGVAFESIEELIEEAPVSVEQRDALWLLVWSRMPEQNRERVLGLR